MRVCGDEQTSVLGYSDSMVIVFRANITYGGWTIRWPSGEWYIPFY